MQSSNPVLSRLGETAEKERRASYGQPPAGSPNYANYPPIYRPDAGYPGSPTPVQPGYGPGPGAGATDRAMQVDDVVTRTIALVVLTTVAAAGSWVFLRSGAWIGLAGLGSIAALVVGLVIAFKQITNPVVISVYAVLQGVVLGVVSRLFEQIYPGIVVQAVAATFGVFFAMAVLYRFRVLRATPKFTRFVIGALFGVVVLSLANWLLSIFGHNLGLAYYSPTEKGGPVAIIFSLVVIVVAALTFILDFDAVEQGIRYGLPERYAWYCAFGILVGLIMLYYQILRLLGYLRR